MENTVKFRYIRHICLIIAFILLPMGVAGYDDADILKAHSEINRQAILQFENSVMPADPFLKTATLNGEKSWGLAWDRAAEGGPGDTLFPSDTRPDMSAQKSLKVWIVSGAYSADEPEGAMALVHFYDPSVPEGDGYLSDQQTIANLLAWGWDPQWANPHTDAVRWGLWDLDLHGQSGNVFVQDYSYADARQNLKSALAAKENSNEYYGKAWRGVGETMHMVADMTVPAHVRNDGHAAMLKDADPYESTTTATHISALAGGKPADLNFRTDVETMMRSVAGFTNKNYLSKDTIPGQTSSKTSYSSPVIAGLSEDGQYYLHQTINGVDTRVAHHSGSQSVFDWGTAAMGSPKIKPVYEIDATVVADQRKVLVPTAIRASTAVLDRFMPRFEATMSYDYADPAKPDSGNYVMHGTIALADGAWNRGEWTNMPVNNGAVILLRDPSGKITKRPVDPQSVSGMNDFTTKFSANKNDDVQLVYDLGGYLIPAKITGKPQAVATPTPTPTPASAGASLTHYSGYGYFSTHFSNIDLNCDDQTTNRIYTTDSLCSALHAKGIANVWCDKPDEGCVATGKHNGISREISYYMLVENYSDTEKMPNRIQDGADRTYAEDGTVTVQQIYRDGTVTELCKINTKSATVSYNCRNTTSASYVKATL